MPARRILRPWAFGPARGWRPVPEGRDQDEARGDVHFKGRTFELPKALLGQHVGFRPTQIDGLWDVFFAANLIAQVDLRAQLRHS